MSDADEEPMETDSHFTEEKRENNVNEAGDSDEGIINDDQFGVECRYEITGGGTFTTGFDIFSEEEQKKMEERAKRFGLKENEKAIIENVDLYSSMGVVVDNENSKHIRLNVIHMRGTEEMSTKDIFKYFEDYAPASIEWINDISCNVVWLDNISAARALLGLSKKIIDLPEVGDSERDKFSDDNNSIEIGDKNDESTINSKEIVSPLPSGLWRKGIDSPKSNRILLRFATRADKKEPRAQRKSEYYKKYGNPNFAGMKRILTESRKREYMQIRGTKSRKASGDDRDETRKNNNPWGELSESWGTLEFVEDNYVSRKNIESRELLPEICKTPERGSIKERLGLKTQKELNTEVVSSIGSATDDSEEDWARRSKVPRMRMHADDEEEKVRKKKLEQFKRKLQKSSTDLRSRLGSRKSLPVVREGIQVIITNDLQRYSTKDADAEEEVEDEEKMMQDSEKEEGEWEEENKVLEEVQEGDSDSDSSSRSSSSSSSEVSEKEIQGPKGSVIKVVPRSKPRVASTVWARLNYKNQGDNPYSDSGNPRNSVPGDLRSRLGHHSRGRSPLRIEVKNDKFDDENSE